MWRSLAFVTVLLALLAYPFIHIFTLKIEVDTSKFAQTSPEFPELEALTHQENVTVNGVFLNVNVAGPKDGKLVVFVHGFPETGLLNWKHQIIHFAKQGYRVIAADNRGTNTSVKGDTDVCNGLKISDDIAALITHYGYEKAFVVGHDWGAVISWLTAIRYPEKVEKLSVLNSPHLGVDFTKTWSQMKKSWYIGYFQVPVLPEMRVEQDNFIFFKAGFSTANKNSYSLEDLGRYEKAWSQPGAVNGMINLYRHVFRNPGSYPKSRVTVPTLILWGKNDPYLETRLAEESQAFCDDAKLVFFENAGHWLPHDEAAAVNRNLQQFFEQK